MCLSMPKNLQIVILDEPLQQDFAWLPCVFLSYIPDGAGKQTRSPLPTLRTTHLFHRSVCRQLIMVEAQGERGSHGAGTMRVIYHKVSLNDHVSPSLIP